MVATLILIQDATGNMHNQEGHLRNAAGQKIDDQRVVIPDIDADIATAQDVDEAARPRTLADYNMTDQYYENRFAIRPPAIQRQDLELKRKYFTLVGQTPYCGLSHEHPMDYLERFEDLVSDIKANGVPEDYLFCKLFKYSLAGEASQWLEKLQPGSLTSWAEIKNAFLCHFFDEARAEDLRIEISTFTHEPTKSFKRSWIRFKSYQRDCPDHGFNEVQLLSTFFRGIALAYPMALDSASDGNFNTRNLEEAVRLIENLASSNITKNTDFERKKLAPALGKEQLGDVKANLDSVHKLLKKQISFAEDVEVVDVDSDMEEEEDHACTFIYAKK